MSIHKSKGLEFPIVILAGAHKSINFMDATAPVLVDQNLGIAVDYVDLERRTKTPTIIKGAMARRIVRESISEEERLLCCNDKSKRKADNHWSCKRCRQDT